MVDYRSVSQLKELWDCGYRYYLHRVHEDPDEPDGRVWQKPAAWLPQGIAVHEAAEAYELSDRTMTLAEVERVYANAYAAHTNRLAADTPNLNYWFASGPYRGPQDIERRFLIGKEQCGKYLAFYDKNPHDKPMVVGDANAKAVEYPFTLTFGDVPVRGVIDYIREDGKPRDNKTGNRAGDPFQLGVYAGVIEQVFDIKPTTGDFWMGKTGKITFPHDLTEYTQDYLADIFGEADQDIKLERFDPDPEPSKCMFCSVAAACKYAA